MEITLEQVQQDTLSLSVRFINTHHEDLFLQCDSGHVMNMEIGGSP
jgi:hypothetical protein